MALEHYVPSGDVKEKRLLFVHSSGHGSWMWEKFLSYFSERGYDAWALNLRGHYLSDPVSDWGEVGVSEYLDDIDRAVKRVGGNVVLVGHSMSGLLVLKYAESHRLAGVIASQTGAPKSALQKRGIEIKGGPPREGRPVTDKAILPMKDREMAKKMLFEKGNVDEETVDMVMKMIGEESVRAGKEIMQMEIAFDKITAPVYVLGFNVAKLGMQLPVDLNKVLAEEAKAKDYKVIEPGGHDYMLEKNWKDFAAQFETWISAQ